MDRITSMETFICVVEKGSFVAAAKDLGISSVMVGKHIRSLEEQLNIRLLYRTTRTSGLTDLGRLYYSQCKEWLKNLEDFEKLLQAQLTDVTGLLRISAPVTFGQNVLIPILVSFMKQYPDLEIELSLSDHKVDLIKEKYDVVFRIGAIENEGLIARPLPDYMIIPVASPHYLSTFGNPKVLHDLKHHCCFGFSQWKGNEVWELCGPNGLEHVHIKPSLRLDNAEAARQAALAGFGILLHSNLLFEKDLKKGRLVRVLPDYAPMKRHMHMLYLPENKQQRKRELFTAHCLEHVWKR